jgi:hypothetical protein
MAYARYDVVADFYVQGFDTAGDSASLALLDLLGPVTGLRVLDVACGRIRLPGCFLSRAGTRPTTPTASRSTWSPGQ